MRVFAAFAASEYIDLGAEARILADEAPAAGAELRAVSRLGSPKRTTSFRLI